jgi:glucose-1-phosphate thymidylyltransferase
MHTIAFEDAAAGHLGVLSAARPACDLTLGAMTLVEALSRFGPVRRIVRPHLARHLAAVAGRRLAVWGGEVDVGSAVDASGHGDLVLTVNARATLATLRELVEAGRPCLVRTAGAVAAAVLRRDASGEAMWAMPAEGTDTDAALESLGLPVADATLDLVAEPHDLIAAHERILHDALSLKIDSGGFAEVRPGLFAAHGARIANEVAVRHGPVLVAADAEIGPFVCLDGPAWIGPRARVNPHAWIRAGTALGRDCRVGGEVEATVMEPFSNKAHDGFLGHSHVGSWVNIAAGTITSNLKATYGPVRLHGVSPAGGRLTTHTGRQFLGALIGDFVKTGINSSIPCGARIGVAATVGGTVPEQVVAFTNQLVGGEAGTRSSPAQAATVLERMMARRGMEILDADRDLLEALAGAAAG